MARYRIELVDGTSQYQEAHREVRTDGTVRLERRVSGDWSVHAEYAHDDVVKISKRHVEINGAWRWSAVFTQEPATRPISA